MRAGSKDVGRLTVLWLLTAAIVVLYAWLTGAGRWTDWPVYTSFVFQQADSFLHGHTYLLVETHPKLLAAANPFDPALIPHGVWDASFYKGRFYLYFGPVPALALALATWAFRLPLIADSHLVFAFAAFRQVVTTALLWTLYRRFARGAPFWTVCAAVVGAGLAVPIPSLLTRGAVYEVVIVAGQAFAAGAVLFALKAAARAVSPAGRTGYLLASGFCIGCAFASRWSLMFGLGLMLLATLVLMARLEPAVRSARRRLGELAALAGPVAAVGLATAVYNYARFDSPLEFGARYHFSSMPATAGLRYLPFNVVTYLLRPLAFARRFPFVSAPDPQGQPPIFSFLETPGYYWPEMVPGIVYVYPFFAFALIGVYAGARAAVRLRREAGASADTALYAWLGTAGLGLSLVSMLPVLVMFCSSMRYMADMTTGLVLLSTVGMWSALRAARRRGPWTGALATALVLASLAWTAAVGVLIATTSQMEHFPRNNPELFQKLERTFDLSAGLPFRRD